MLKRLYVDNYKCLVNFEFRPESYQLLMGSNGSGKTTCAVLLTALRHLAIGGDKGSVVDWFGPQSRSVWLKNPKQLVELEALLAGSLYRYVLDLEPFVMPGVGGGRMAVRVGKETLEIDGEPAFEFRDGRLSIFKARRAETLDFSFDWYKSALAFFQPRPENERIVAFKHWLEKISYFRFRPPLSSDANEENYRPTVELENFGSWFRHLLQEHPGVYHDVLPRLQDSIDGLQGLRVRTSEVGLKDLGAELRVGGARAELPFQSLSDGQQVLCALYLTSAWALRNDHLIIFDEPDNFVALRELQPWLGFLDDLLEQSGGQIFIVSHHPELLNQLATERGIVFRKLDTGWVKAEPFHAKTQGELTPAELVARGWENV